MGAFAKAKTLLAGTFERGAKAARAEAAADEALRALQAERIEIGTKISQLVAKRDARMLDGDTDSDDMAVAEIAGQIDRLAIRRDRLGLIEPQLVQRLQDAKGAAAMHRWANYAARYNERATAYLVSLRDAGEQLADLHALRHEIGAAGFMREIGAVPAEPYLVNNPAGLAQFESDVDRIVGDEARRNARHATVVAPPARSQPSEYRAPAREFAPAAAPPKAVAKRTPTPAPLPPVKERPLLTELTLPLDADGHVNIMLIRPTEIAGRRIEAGEVKLLPGEAMAVLRQGAGDLSTAMVTQ